MLYDGELDHQHANLENEVTNTRRDLHGTDARLVEVDNQLQAVIGELRGDLSTARHAIVELDDALTALRAEHADFKQHAAANLASLNELATELTAEVAKDPEFTKMTVGLLRALTFNLGFQFRGETRPGDWDPDVEWARLAGETEADNPAPKDSPATDAKLSRELTDALYKFEPRQSDDDVKRDLELTCRDCGEVLCDIEPGDDFDVLVRMALEHECGAREIVPSPPRPAPPQEG